MRFAFRALALAVVLSSLHGERAYAATDCVFETRGSTWFLRANCQTDQTLIIPDGFTLDGRGRSITALDPPGGHFVGAIVRNGGATAHVRNLTLDTQALANVCDPAAPQDDRLRGILFENASGTIIGNRVLNIHQGESGCQEGFGIEARKAPYDGTHPATERVYIAGNRVVDYQKIGILVNGDVEAGVYHNVVTGFGTIPFIAQNGIQFGFGAAGNIKLNRVSQNIYEGLETQAACILLTQADDGIEVALNHVDACDTGISVDGTDGVLLVANHISNSVRYGAVVLGDVNTWLGNHVRRSLGVGIYVSGEGNSFEGNFVHKSGEFDIYNEGDNDYAFNHCGTSSGAPVDCP